MAVTQQFNTTTSLGRLTLNILLSFAQFEREIISERTRQRALEIANDADLRIRAPKNFLKGEPDERRTAEACIPPTADPRLPRPGTRLVRRFRGKDVVVLVRQDGFEYERRLYRSLSAAVRAATGTPWNGFAFFGLGHRPGRERGERE